MSDENNISDEDKEAQQAAQEYYKSNFSGQTPAGSTTPSTQQTNHDDDEIQKSAQDYVKSLTPQVSIPAAPLPKSQPVQDSGRSMSDYDQAIKTSLGLTGAAYGGIGSARNKDFFPSLKIDTSQFQPKENTSNPPQAGGLPSVDDGTPAADPYDEAVEKEMQRLDSTYKPNNRGRVENFNGETQRRALETKNNLQNPALANQMISAGPMEDRNGILIPKNVNYQIGQEEQTALRNQAQQNIAQQQDAALKAQQQAEQMAQAEQAAQRSAKLNAKVSGASKIGANAVGAANAMSGMYDTYASGRDSGWGAGRTITKGMSTLGGLAQMAPIPAVRAVGSVLQLPESAANTNQTINDPNATLTSKITKGLSTAGLGAMAIPTPWTEAAGVAAQIPEGIRQVWNLPDYYNPSTDKNRPHPH